MQAPIFDQIARLDSVGSSSVTTLGRPQSRGGPVKPVYSRPLTPLRGQSHSSEHSANKNNGWVKSMAPDDNSLPKPEAVQSIGSQIKKVEVSIHFLIR